MLTMNYQDLQYKYSKPKKKKAKRLKNEKYPLGKKHFSTNEWMEYKDWLKEQKLKEKLLEKVQNKKKKTKGKNTKVKKENPPKIRKTSKERYNEQLQDERWKEKRLQVLSRYGNQCIICGSKIVEIHHLKYKKGKKAWEYEVTNLIPLCRECHEMVHNDPNHEYYPKYF